MAPIRQPDWMVRGRLQTLRSFRALMWDTRSQRRPALLVRGVTAS